ncbi:MAG: alpha-L-rhamnosidase [Bacteroidaceae bacterium]|nr:alpha-L-rhamnosidase [Bacteroidaceae bacterium]
MKHKTTSRFFVLLAALAAYSTASHSQTTQKTEGLCLPPMLQQDSNLMRADEMTRVYVTPKRVLWTDGAVSDPEKLLVPNSGQSDIFSDGMCRLQTPGGKTASIILDFGCELHGGLKLVISSCAPSVTPQARIRFGESVSETCSELKVATKAFEDVKTPGQENTATNDHAVRDMELTLPFYGQIEIGSSGFRFVRIDLLTPDMTINLKEATAILRYRDIPYLGSFRCDNERLNQIWMTGAYTVHLNMQEYIWDGVKRDRLIWLGDMHPETSTISAVFGDNESFYASMDLAAKQWPLPSWFNGMSAYSMWYLIIQHDWYMHNGRKDFLEKHADYIKGLVDLIDTKVAEDGTETLSPNRFLDWPSTPNTEGVESGYRALLVWAMKDAAVLCRILGDEGRARKSEDIIARLNKKVMPHHDLKQAASLMAIAGLQTPKEACERCVAKDGAKGFSTFYGYYMLQAMAMNGQYEEAMDIISQYWGGMLDMGATSFWEDFDLAWTKNAGRIDDFVPEGKKDIHGDFGAYCYPGFRHSLCHGWASGPTAWLSEHVLGVTPLEPGCRKVKITPHLGKLKWVEGTYPTPQGVITIRHERRDDGTIKSDIKAPKGVKVVKE